MALAAAAAAAALTGETKGDGKAADSKIDPTSTGPVSNLVRARALRRLAVALCQLCLLLAAVCLLCPGCAVPRRAPAPST